MYQVFDAWWVNVVKNNKESLRTTQAFAAELGCSSIRDLEALYLEYPSRPKLPLGQPISWLKIKSFFIS